MSLYVLVINAGSSSLKYSLVDTESGEAAASGVVERIGEDDGRQVHRGPQGQRSTALAVSSCEEALQAAIDAFGNDGPALDEIDLVAVGHRVVHGGSWFSEPVLIDDELVAKVTELIPLAPVHNPANLEGIRVARRLFPDLPQIAVFDTAFHQTLPATAYTYAVPRELLAEHGVRRYGFHGTSHAFVSAEAARILGRSSDEVNLVVLHLGNGCSATAVRGGRSVDTSMGMTPLEGLVMGTRSGDVDPAIHAYLSRELGWSLDKIDHLLNFDSGVKGLAGYNDFRELTKRRAAGDEHAQLAFDVFCYRVKKYIGAYYAALGTVDAIVFTAGVGEHDPDVREASLAGLDRLGIRLDPQRNAVSARTISTDDSPVAVLVIPTNEEWQIARETLDVLHQSG